jgi:hypothetical protein
MRPIAAHPRHHSRSIARWRRSTTTCQPLKSPEAVGLQAGAKHRDRPVSGGVRPRFTRSPCRERLSASSEPPSLSCVLTDPGASGHNLRRQWGHLPCPRGARRRITGIPLTGEVGTRGKTTFMLPIVWECAAKARSCFLSAARCKRSAEEPRPLVTTRRRLTDSAERAQVYGSSKDLCSVCHRCSVDLVFPARRDSVVAVARF